MSSIMAGNGYPFLDYTPQFNTYQATFAGVYGPYDFTRSPTTSGGSDESMNDSKTDPKKSPKYLEKRAKNNEAAKKSRLQRKKREMEHQAENAKLKERIGHLEIQNQQLIAEMENLQKTIVELTQQRERDAMVVMNGLTDVKYAPLQDITNQSRQQQQLFPTYQSM